MSEAFNFTIKGGPDFSCLEIDLAAGQSVKAEASAMISMDVNVGMKTAFRGLKTALLGGERFFVNEFTAEHVPGKIMLGGGLPGDIVHIPLSGGKVFVQSGGYLASSPGIEVETKWGGARGFFSGLGLFLLQCSGRGDLFLSSFGSIIPIEVKESLVIDTEHIAAFTEGLDYKIEKVAGYKALFLSGEGLVARFRGEGKVYVQSHKYGPFVGWLDAFRPRPNR